MSHLTFLVAFLSALFSPRCLICLIISLGLKSLSPCAFLDFPGALDYIRNIKEISPQSDRVCTYDHNKHISRFSRYCF